MSRRTWNSSSARRGGNSSTRWRKSRPGRGSRSRDGSTDSTVGGARSGACSSAMRWPCRSTGTTTWRRCSGISASSAISVAAQLPSQFNHVAGQHRKCRTRLPGRRSCRSVILHGKKHLWGQPNRHYHEGLQSGDNTLNLLCVRVLLRSLSKTGRYDAAIFCASTSPS